MRLQQKIHISTFAVFIPLMITILAISLNLKDQARETFYQEAETVANFVDFICQNEVDKIDLAIKAVLNDNSLPTYFLLELSDTLNFRCRKLSDKFDLTLLALFNRDGSFSTFHIPDQNRSHDENHKMEDKISFLLKELKAPQAGNQQNLITFADQLYLIYKAPLITNQEETIGTIGLALPFPSETFFDDIYALSSATLEVAFWRGRKLLVGSPTLTSSHHYRQQRPTSRQRALRLEDGTIFTGKSFGAAGTRDAEVVFNTSMTGYQEILTDPSYCGQIVTMTYPLDRQLRRLR